MLVFILSTDTLGRAISQGLGGGVSSNYLYTLPPGHLPFIGCKDHLPSLSGGKLKENGDEKCPESLSSATTTVDPSSPSFSQITSSWGGRVGLLSLTSSITRMTVPVPVLKAENEAKTFAFHQHGWDEREHDGSFAFRFIMFLKMCIKPGKARSFHQARTQYCHKHILKWF